MDNTQLKAIATSLETKAGASTVANESREGYWKRIAVAAEVIAGASTTANEGLEGYMLRAAKAFEGTAGTTGVEETEGYTGFLKRIVDALEVKSGVVGTSDMPSRMVTAAENATFAGATAIALTNNFGTSVTSVANDYTRIAKIAGAAGIWDASAVSDVAMAGDFLLRIKLLQTNLNLMVGVNADPLTNSDWTSLDRAVQFTPTATIIPITSAAQGASVGAYNTNTFYFLRRVGSVVTLLSNATDTLTGATLVHTFATYSATCYFDSSLADTGATVDVKLTQ